MHADLKLGQLIDPSQKRDAIHIAVAPVVAAERLYPGQGIGLVESGNTEKVGSVALENEIGIVDPFLRGPVYPEQRCWMFLFPQTVTGMRHEWQHPSFDASQTAVDDKEASLAWMRAFAAKHWSNGEDYDGWNGPYTAEILIESAHEFLESGDRHVQQGSESLRDNTPRIEFWKHFEVITGRKVGDDDWAQTPFCCTC